MPRFFFDLRDSDEVLDDTGIEFATIEDAKQAAIQELAEMVAHGTIQSNQPVMCRIRDDSAVRFEALFELRFQQVDRE